MLYMLSIFHTIIVTPGLNAGYLQVFSGEDEKRTAIDSQREQGEGGTDGTIISEHDTTFLSIRYALRCKEGPAISTCCTHIGVGILSQLRFVIFCVPPDDTGTGCFGHEHKIVIRTRSHSGHLQC